MTPKYPNVYVPLAGQDGNAFSILGRVRRAMKKEGIDPAVISEYHSEATSGDYNHLLLTTMQWVNTDEEDYEEDDEDYDDVDFGRRPSSLPWTEDDNEYDSEPGEDDEDQR